MAIGGPGGPAATGDWAFWRAGDYWRFRKWGPLELRKLSIRIRGIDTPEKGYRAKCAYEKEQGKIATQFVTDVIADAAATNTPITFGDVSWGKYGGRIIADMYVGTENYSDLILAAGLAKRYDGGTKSSFCD